MTAPDNGAPPAARLVQMAVGYWVSQALNVVARLGVADHLKDGPRSADELASRLRVNAAALYRVLRCMAGYGVFRERPDGAFEQTPASELLRGDIRGSLRSMVLFQNADWHWKVYLDMFHSVQTGEAAARRALGAPVFEWFATHPDEARVFDDAMRGFSESVNPAIAEAYDYSSFGTLVDVGGGTGGLISGILQANPRLKGQIVEMPHVVERARENLRSLGLDQRCLVAGGDFFEAVPEGADAYVLKFIIHDWDDERCTTLLRNIGRAMARDGRVLTVEQVVPEGNDPDLSKVTDIEMLVLVGGRERTASEFERLYEAAGLKLTRMIPTKSPFFIIEGVRA